MKCKNCGREPKNITEYIIGAKEEGMTPNQFVREQEGTYNPRTDLFYCTKCYIELGMPTGKA